MNTENILNECSGSTNTNQTYYDFSYLPPHIIAQVLTYLNLYDFKSAATTCHSWNMASCDPQFGKRFTIWIENQTTINERYIVRPVKSIRFNEVDMHRSDIRQLFQCHGHQMEQVVLHRCLLRSTQLFRAIYYMSGIKVLKIHFSELNCRVDNNFRNSNVFKKYYSKVMENLNGLKLLEINIQNRSILPYGVDVLLTGCKHLETLVWNGSQRYSRPDEFSVTSKLLDKSSQCIANSIRSLTIHRLDPLFSRAVFEKLIDLDLPQITRLNLKKISSNYYDNIFRKFCIRYCALDSLQLDGCNTLQLSDICSYMPNLKSLHLENLMATNLVEIAHLKHLTSLHLEHVFEVPIDSLTELFHTKFEYLTRLAVEDVTANMLNLICSNMLNLQYLTLILIATTDCTPIFKNLTKLKELSISLRDATYVPSNTIVSDDVYNITRLTDLKLIYITCFVPGITPTLIAKLPGLVIFEPPFEEDFDSGSSD